MINLRKIGAAALAGVLAISAAPVMANDFVNAEIVFGNEEAAETRPNFLSFSGVITEINPAEFGQIHVQNAEGSTVVFNLNVNTFVLSETALAVGSEVTGFYSANGIMTLQYPPHHQATVIAAIPHNIIVDRFEVMENGSFVSAGNELVLNISDSTPIIFQDGLDVRENLFDRTLEEVLDGRILAVTYDIANRMMPPGTIPADPALTITVLFETAVHLPGFGFDIENGFDIGFVDFATPDYHNFSGVVTEVTEMEHITRVRLENAEGGITDFNIDHMTHIMGETPTIGDNVQGFFNIMLPAIMIYPPQYTARVLINGEQEAMFTFVGQFEVAENGSFISDSDMGLVLNINDETPITLPNGENVREILGEQTLEEFLNGRTLAVNYTLSNRAMIPGTMPADPTLSVVVLYVHAVTLPGLVGDFDLGFDNEDGNMWAYNYGISVNGRMLDALWHYQDGGYFVPFRAVVNMLGFGASVTWDDETRHIGVSNGTHEIRFAVGSDSFIVGEMDVVLSHPAILVDATTYVPFKFFQDVFGMNNAWMHAGQIFIDNEETMQ
ncbi:MAG: copper amine oxidase N-terminal domain-containing protein [Defluviitaleaceae bacterium]|nr:copper amine oxidase N-terminal domain-containing protein [Defluviitaleaceae bacterium]